MSKTIVICCDGTGNSDTGVPSNVKQLYDFVLVDAAQVATYHRGVGTDARRDGQSWLAYTWRHVTELCFGEGIDATLADLYGWLAAAYDDGDRLFLFGFSRGAFTARALAGMIHVCGLLKRGEPVSPHDVVRRYRGSEARIKAERRRRGLPAACGPCEIDHAAVDVDAMEFAARHCRPCVIDFLGLWDTVKAYGWVWPRSFPALRHNTSVRTVRHAAALDEGRALFQMTGWASAHIDVKEVWFAGDHSDVGGGHETGNSALADASLRWMLGEAYGAGMRLTPPPDERGAALRHAGALAPGTPPKGRWKRWAFLPLDCLPRIELDNHAYPPRRAARMLWPFGARCPGDHAFGSTVWVHDSVDARRLGGDRCYRTSRLVRRSWSLRRRAPLDVRRVCDRPVPWEDQRSDTTIRSASTTIVTP